MRQVGRRRCAMERRSILHERRGSRRRRTKVLLLYDRHRVDGRQNIVESSRQGSRIGRRATTRWRRRHGFGWRRRDERGKQCHRLTPRTGLASSSTWRGRAERGCAGRGQTEVVTAISRAERCAVSGEAAPTVVTERSTITRAPHTREAVGTRSSRSRRDGLERGRSGMTSTVLALHTDASGPGHALTIRSTRRCVAVHTPSTVPLE